MCRAQCVGLCGQADVGCQMFQPSACQHNCGMAGGGGIQVIETLANDPEERGDGERGTARQWRPRQRTHHV